MLLILLILNPIEITEKEMPIIKVTENPQIVEATKKEIPTIKVTEKTPIIEAAEKEITSRSKLNRQETVEFKATAYDLSVISCGKGLNHPQYGVTYSGISIAGKTRKEASCVAVDPEIIPLGSLMIITFDDRNYQKYNGQYQALDIGGAVKGKHVDLFLGDFGSTKENQEVYMFGVVKCKVTIIREGW